MSSSKRAVAALLAQVDTGIRKGSILDAITLFPVASFLDEFLDVQYFHAEGMNTPRLMVLLLPPPVTGSGANILLSEVKRKGCCTTLSGYRIHSPPYESAAEPRF